MKCRNCGSELEENMKFCNVCGTKVEQNNNQINNKSDNKSSNKALVTFLEIIDVFLIVIGFIIASAGDGVYLLVLSVLALIFGECGEKIAVSKGISGGFYLGFFLGVIGFIVVCTMPAEKTSQKTSVVVRETNKYDDIKKLQELKESGAITEEEFNSEKARILK